MKIVVKYKKLGREKAHGMAFSDGEIHIDPRLKGRKLMEVYIHEVMHLLHPEDDEDTIVTNSVILCKFLWRMGYRKVDNTRNEPLQDGSK